MESPDKCDKCVGYSICANHIKKGDFACAPFLRANEEKMKSPNNERDEICCLVDAYDNSDMTKVVEIIQRNIVEWRKLSPVS